MSKTIKHKIDTFVVAMLLLFSIVSGLLIYFYTTNRVYQSESHLVLLAKQFTQFRLDLDPSTKLQNDFLDYHGKLYLYFGPFSSLILIPFAVFFGEQFPQVSLGIISLIVSFASIYYIAQRKSFSKNDSLWLAIFFVFSTSLFQVGITNISTYIVQALGTSLVLLSLVEFFAKKRWFIIGIFIACAGLTRMTLYPSVIFYLLHIFTTKQRLKKALLLLAPIAISVLILGSYNFLRFHSVFESGYQYNKTLMNSYMQSNLAYGFLSSKHIAANLYVLLFKAPVPVKLGGEGLTLWFPFLRADVWGMAIWFTSPLFLFLINVNRKNINYPALITGLLLLLPSLLYFGIGMVQFGYRYSLDFLPFIFLILLGALKPKLPFVAKALIVYGVLFNSLYYASIWGIYPHFFGKMRIF